MFHYPQSSEMHTVDSRYITAEWDKKAHHTVMSILKCSSCVKRTKKTPFCEFVVEKWPRNTESALYVPVNRVIIGLDYGLLSIWF